MNPVIKKRIEVTENVVTDATAIFPPSPKFNRPTTLCMTIKF